MSTEETGNLARNYLDVLNRVLRTRDFALLAIVAAADLVDHGAGVGLESWATVTAATLGDFPDAQVSAEAILADGNMAAIRGVLRGTHLGEGMGIPPTGKTVTVEFADIVRFQDGLAAER
jgi:predicted ester cyclase